MTVLIHKKLLCLTLSALMLFSLFSGCGKSEEPDTVPEPSYAGAPAAPETSPVSVVQKGSDSIFSINYNPDEPTNPYLLSTQTNAVVSGLIYEGLFSVNQNFEAENVLCESYKTSDGINFTFTVNRGTLFHDGVELTAEDAVYSINCAMQCPRYASRLACISSVSADSRYILSITLFTANNSLPLLLDIPVIRSGSAGQAAPAGTGPYSISSVDDYLFLKAFSDWRDFPTLSLGRIYLKEYETSALTSAFETGYIDLALSDPAGITYMSFGGDNEVWHYDTTSMQYLGFNANRGFLSNAWARRAVALAIDRNYIVETCMTGCALASTLPVSPVSPLWDSGINAKNDYSVKDMATLLYENGAVDSNGDGFLEYDVTGISVSFSLDFIVNTENMNRLDAARHIASELKSAGFNITLRELSWADYKSALEQGNFDMYYGEVMLTPDFDLTSLLTQGGALNYGGASSAECTNLIASALAADEMHRAAAVKELCEYLSDYSPIAPILFKREAVLTRRGAVSGATPTQYNVFNGIADWDIKTN